MTVTSEGGTAEYFVTSGSYTVNEDRSVSIIAEEACEVGEIDKEACSAALAELSVSWVNKFTFIWLQF